MGGLAGLTGPLVILFYLAATPSGQCGRAPSFSLRLGCRAGGKPPAGDHCAIVLAACLGVPYLLATALGQAAFRPGREGLYRNVAYAVIGVAILTGLPLWGS